MSEIDQLRAENAQLKAACAEMRNLLKRYNHLPECNKRRDYSDGKSGPCDCGRNYALSTDAGKGWLSPEVRRQLQDALEHWHFYYKARLEEADEIAAKCEKEGDKYGWNYHKGVRSGLINHDIGLCKIKQALAALEEK